MIERGKRRAGLADFLKSRRARLRPEEFDLPTFQRRRTRGLRREELAQLIGVGISWYTWLEQGRDIQVSDHVLERLVSILRLNEEERRHLFALARGPVPLPDEQGSEHNINISNTSTQAILDGFIYPARLFDRRLNIVGWNESACRIFGDYASFTKRDRNCVWFHFMHPASRTLHIHWEQEARRCLAFLHVKYDQAPDDPWLTELIADLQQASPDFRVWWPEHDITLACGKFFEINHPLMGHLAFEPATLTLSSLPGMELVVYTPYPQGDTAARLNAFSSLEAVKP